MMVKKTVCDCLKHLPFLIFFIYLFFLIFRPENKHHSPQLPLKFVLNQAGLNRVTPTVPWHKTTELPDLPDWSSEISHIQAHSVKQASSLAFDSLPWLLLLASRASECHKPSYCTQIILICLCHCIYLQYDNMQSTSCLVWMTCCVLHCFQCWVVTD